LREILDAISYIVVRSGCAWRLLPHDFPPWKTVHHYLRTWRKNGSWERINAALRERLRVRMKRTLSRALAWWTASPSRAPLWGRRARLRRRQKGQGHSKRHLLVDTEGFVLKARVHSAKVMDYEGIKALLERADEAFPRLCHVWLDAG
jgi:putative transposase